MIPNEQVFTSLYFSQSFSLAVRSNRHFTDGRMRKVVKSDSPKNHKLSHDTQENNSKTFINLPQS